MTVPKERTRSTANSFVDSHLFRNKTVPIEKTSNQTHCSVVIALSESLQSVVCPIKSKETIRLYRGKHLNPHCPL